MKNHYISRRDFMRNTSLAAAGTILGADEKAADQAASTSESKPPPTPYV